MSECLHCGDCCRFLSPFTGSEDEPCPHLIERRDICCAPVYLCGIYESRPEQCRAHDFADHRWCPVGDMVLRAGHPSSYVDRVNAVWDATHK